MALRDEIGFITKIILGVLLNLILVHASNRCDYAKSSSASETVWKYEGENVTLKCPEYKDDNNNSSSYGIDFKWYRQDYNCNNMTNIVARHMSDIKGNSGDDVKDPERMTINNTTGALTITNVGLKDEETFTCIFSQLEEFVAEVQLKIKDFQPPIIFGLSDGLVEDEVRNVECQVPYMYPAEGYIQMRYNGKVSEKFFDGHTPLQVSVQIEGEAEADGNIVSCTAIQNVSGAVKKHSTSLPVAVLYPYHTKVVSSVPEQLIKSFDVTLSCTITREGNPKVISRYTWLKDGHEIQGGQKITLRNVTSEDAGSYKCLITNRNISTALIDAKEVQLDVAHFKWNYISLPGLISVGAILAAVVVIACTITAVLTRAKGRENQINANQSGQNEDQHNYTALRLSRLHSNTQAQCSGSENIYEESIELQLPPPPTPPPLPDMTNRRPLDLCPEADQHYTNRTAIMATTPRKPRSSIVKTDTLEDILEYCKNNYSACCEASAGKQGTTIPGFDINMNGVNEETDSTLDLEDV